MMNVAVGGLLMANLAAALIRMALGVFFVLARFRFFYDPSKPKGKRVFCSDRRDSLTRKMTHCGLKKWPMQWAVFVAAAEVLAGIALIFGLLSVLAAAGMLILLLYATKCTCKEKVAKQNPVDTIDVACCYMWTPEPLYIVLSVLVILLGPGAYSLDALFWG